MIRTILIAAGVLACTTVQAAPITYTPGTYTYVVSMTGTYSFSVQGGQGGSDYQSTGGLGADATGNFNLTAGEQLSISVGNVGQYHSAHGGAGAGSFIYVTATNVLLLAGGGGGGASDSDFRNGDSPNNGGNADTASTLLVETGGSVAGVDGQDGTCCGLGSTSGAGGLSYVDIASLDGFAGSNTITLASGGGAGAVTITAPAATTVPEPGTVVLLGAGVFCVGLTRRLRTSLS